MSPNNARYLSLGKWVAIALVGTVICVGVLSIYVGRTAQWDFRIYYAAALLHQSGISPYDSTHFRDLVGETTLYYPYPPFTLYLFYPFTALGLPAATTVYLTLKIAALVVLIALWMRTFGLFKDKWLFLFFVFFAFNGAVILDLRSGNCCMFEQVLIALGMYCYSKGKIAGAAAAITLAAGLKLGPILLLGILVSSGRKREILYAVGFGALFAAVFAAAAIVSPALFSDFAHGIGRLHERAPDNPATWPLVVDIVDAVQQTAQLQLPQLTKNGIFFAIVVTAGAVSLLSLRRFQLREHPEARLWRICLVTLLYAVVMPRFKNYTYILLVGPSFYLLTSSRLPRPIILACALLMMFTYRGYIELGRVFQPFFWVAGEYYSLLLAWLLWGLCCYSMARWGLDATSPAGSTGSDDPEHRRVGTATPKLGTEHGHALV
jgi:hypothetical protein